MQKSIVLTGLALLLCSCAIPATQNGKHSSSDSLSSFSSSIPLPPTVATNEEEQTGLLVETEEQSSNEGGAETSTGTLLETALADGTLLIGIHDLPELTVYTNASCAYCRDFLLEQLPALKTEFIATKKIHMRIVTVPFKKYPNSATEAAAVFCASREQKGVAMLTALHQLTVHDRKNVQTAATKLSMNAAFGTCLNSAEAKGAIKAGETSGITLVPSFALNGKFLTGLSSLADLRGWVREEATVRN